jgi:hypothetical protein
LNDVFATFTQRLHQERYKLALEAEKREREQRIRLLQEKWKSQTAEKSTVSTCVHDSPKDKHSAVSKETTEVEETLEQKLENLRLDDSQHSNDIHQQQHYSSTLHSPENVNYNSERKESSSRLLLNNEEKQKLQTEKERKKGRGRRGRGRGRGRERGRGRGRGRGTRSQREPQKIQEDEQKTDET